MVGVLPYTVGTPRPHGGDWMSLRESGPEDPARIPRAGLHPAVYAAAAGTVLWLVLGICALIGRPGHSFLVLAVVIAFFAMAVGIPTVLWRISMQDPRHELGDGQEAHEGGYRDWARKDVEVQWGKMKGSHVAIEILTPLVAAAAGMTLFVILAYIAVGGA